MAGTCVVDALLSCALESNVDSNAVAARQAALAALSPAAQKGDERALAVLASSLEDWHASVRKAAVDGLIEVVQKGDRRVVYARMFAVRALAPLARKGDDKALAAVVAGLKDAHQTVRSTAFEEISQMAMHGDSNVSGELSAKIGAIEALASVASAKCPEQLQAISALAACIQDWHAAVRSQASTALHGLLGKAGLAAASAAVEAFAPLAFEGDSKAMAFLVAALGSEDVELATLRRQALGCVVRVAIGTDSAYEAQLAVKVAATQALSKEILAKESTFSGRDLEGVAAALTILLADWHADVRQVALDTLCKLAEATQGRGPCGRLAVEALTPKACEGETKALACLGRLAELGTE
eukprot:TRINITY_DN95347_c0_g1_i1.p1 TRINITY_DN95347_c0_g1~~TRINITY_DN95347_c0_g1_i1.p1  ORF type:complete len:386 (+),score=100.65 TRINITY_DN95347_c0_g1_i1:94-1158(+)